MSARTLLEELPPRDRRRLLFSMAWGQVLDALRIAVSALTWKYLGAQARHDLAASLEEMAEKAVRLRDDRS